MTDPQQRTERATPKRLATARRRGQIPRSRELSAAAVLMSGGGALYALGNPVAGGLYGVMKRGLTLTREQALDPMHMLPTLAAAARDAALVCAPILGLIMLAALIAPLVLGGWSFSTQALLPQFSRLNPVTGIQRIFSGRSLIELGKALAKVGVVGGVVVLVLRHQAPALLSLGDAPIATAIVHAIRLSGQALVAVSAGMLLIAAVDVPLQRWQHAQQLKMTREEIRQELKESDGSPQVKGQIRQMQQKMASRRVTQDARRSACTARVGARRRCVFSAYPRNRKGKQHACVGRPDSRFTAVSRTVSPCSPLRGARWRNREVVPPR